MKTVLAAMWNENKIDAANITVKSFKKTHLLPIKSQNNMKATGGP